MRRVLYIAALALIAINSGFFCEAASPFAEFTLLESLSMTGRKPSSPMPSSGDWLVGTSDDHSLATSYNPSGAWSHNMADLTGMAGAGFNLAPSLAGSLTLALTPSSTGIWNVSVTDLDYIGQATPFLLMNQSLATPESAAAQSQAFGVDGLGNSGTWLRSPAHNWSISYELDSYFTTNADGDAPINPNDVDVAFNNKLQRGYLLPVSVLTPVGLSNLALDDPAGYFSGSFHDYLLNVVAPTLPADASYLLITQMGKTAPDYAEPGLPITTAGLIGNTTIAYTTAILPEPTQISLVVLAAGTLAVCRRS